MKSEISHGLGYLEFIGDVSKPDFCEMVKVEIVVGHRVNAAEY